MYINLTYKMEKDFDGDNIPDSVDEDDDNDNYPDKWEIILNSSAFDNNSIPLDTDLDKIPDGDKYNSELWMDKDDDDDNFTDEEELKADTDPLNSSDYPGSDKPTRDENEKEQGIELENVFFYVIVVFIIVIVIIFYLIIHNKNRRSN